MSDADPDDRAELLDHDKLGGEFPPEQPLAVFEYGTTGAEERFEEPLAERVAREEPEPSMIEADRQGVDDLVDPFAASLDTEPEAVADATHLVRPDHPEPPDPTTDDFATEMEAPPPAEVDAIHVIEPPP